MVERKQRKRTSKKASQSFKRARDSSDDLSEMPAKQRRASVQEADDTLHFERLVGVPFPVKITAIPQILSLIDKFLMSPEEAAVAAATTGEVEWLRQLVTKFGRSVASPQTLVLAVTNDHEEVVRLLVAAFSSLYHMKEADLAKSSVAAVVIAGRNGQLGILKILLQERILDYSLSYERSRNAILRALDKAAGHGHLDVVEFIVQYARDIYGDQEFEDKSKALSCAIAGGHTTLVEFMLALDGVRWNLAHAFVVAVNSDQKTYAKTIYEVYPQFNKGESIMIALASNGHTDAVEYLFKELSSSIELLSKAYLGATSRGQTDVITFLLSTNRVPPDTIGKAFVAAVKSGNTKLAGFLWENSQVSSGGIDEAFVSTVGRGNYDLLQILDKYHRVSAEAVLQAFTRAANGLGLSEPKMKYIVDLLFDEKRVPRETKYQAFVTVARSRKKKVIRMLDYRQKGNWPLGVLKEVFDASHDTDMKRIISKITCEQLFDPNFSGRFDAIVNVMENRKE